MHFGRVQSDKGLDLSLPPVGSRTSGYLKLPHEGRGLIYAGAPIWSCSGWKDNIYPSTARPSEYLRYYAQHFSMIEYNGSFYNVPSRDQVHAWRQDVGPEFRFCPKVPKDVSHQLASPDKVLLRSFMDRLEIFGDKLGLSFLQLPEWFTVDEFPLLANFVKGWAKDFPLAVEFRHRSWFHGPMLLDPVINFLYLNKLATVITDTPGRRDALHMSLTYPSVLVRFMGVFPSNSDQVRLRAWLDRLQDWAHAGMDSIYLAVHQEKNGSIPQTVDFIHRYLFEKSFENVVTPDQGRGLH